MRKFLFHLFIYIKRILKNIIFQAVSLAVLLVGMGITYAAWQTINSSEWAAGQPVTQTLVQKIINNLNDLNTRLSVVNPSGTTLSGSSLCIGSNCKTGWDSLMDNASKNSNGYTILPSGVIIAWWSASITSDGSSGVSAYQTITRPIACPTNAWQVVATQDASTVGTVPGNYSVILGDLTLSNFKMALDDASASTRTRTVRWQSICW